MSCRHHRWEIVVSGNETHELPMNDISQNMKVKLSPRSNQEKSLEEMKWNIKGHFVFILNLDLRLLIFFCKMHAFSALITFFEKIADVIKN